MGADLEPEAHLLHVQRLGSLAVFLQLLGALIIVLTPVDDFGNGRIGVWRNLNQIELLLLCSGQSLLLAQNAELLTILIDDTQLGCPNLLIQASVLGDIPSPLVFDFNVLEL